MNNSINKNIDKLNVKVKFLDDHVDYFTINMNSLGSELFQKVAIKSKLIESYFFGLSYESIDSDLCWLDLRKPIKKQVNIDYEYSYDFCVKFYTPDPNMLQDSLTKQLFILQLKKDLSKGELICCDSTKILLGAFFIKLSHPNSAELETSIFHFYLRQLFNEQNLSLNLMDQSLDFLKSLKNQTIERTQYDLLETVRKIDFYGMKMHPAKDIEGLSLNLAVYHLGIVIFQKCTKINTFNWSKIRKLSFKRKRFLIKLHSEEYLELFILWVVQGFYKDTLEFYFDSRNSCKNFWKKCIEHHSFFRCQSSRSRFHDTANKFHRNLSGSRFRYVGLTQAELIQIQYQSCKTNNCFHRSESACGINSRDFSLCQFAATNPSLRSESVNYFPLLMEPSSPDSFDIKITEPHVGHISISCDIDNSLWTQREDVNNGKEINQEISGEDLYKRHPMLYTYENQEISQLKIQNNESYNQQKFDNDSLSSSTIIINKKIEMIEISQSISDTSLTNDCLGSYEFIPKLLAQVMSSDEYSFEFPISNNELNPLGEESTNDGSNSRSLVSTSITSDAPYYLSILNSVVKDFLFNEFTHVKELHVMKEIIDDEVPSMSKIIDVLISLITATETLISNLERRVQINIESFNEFQTSANYFLIVIDEYFDKTLEIFKNYLKFVEQIVKGDSSLILPLICLRQTQLVHLTKSFFHVKNPLRLLFSIIFHQRSRYKCFITINEFILNKKEDHYLCKSIIMKIKPTINSIEILEDECQQLIFTTSIQNLHKTQLKRFGWLQKLSSKGASNRLFAITHEEFICLKKLQSNAFIVEQSWKLSDVRVGASSDITNYSNGYSNNVSSLELITITLSINSMSPKSKSNIVMLADSRKSQSLWINEIKNNKDLHIKATEKSKPEIYRIKKEWIQDYQFIEMCWHERVSLTWNHVKFLFQLVLSSYILKKCKLSSNWQRLWIVLADYRLYFYKTHDDREAVTSLSLIGFQITEPNLLDAIHKDWVLKLSKESKTYFLRTENQYFYLRWRTALQYCTSFAN